MIGSWEIQNIDVALMDRELAMANLDASVLLCQSINSGSLPKTFHHAKVVMSLAYHGIELFLKSGIRRKGHDPTRYGHDLRKLQASYKELHPKPNLHFEVPFFPVYLGFTEEQLQQMLKEERPFYQHLRYHLDRGGEPWPEIHGFDPDRYISEFTGLQDRFWEISKTMDGQQGA